MALFRKDKKEKTSADDSGDAGAHVVIGRTAHSGVCRADRQFSRCWLRTKPMRQCPCCHTPFDSAHDPYAKFQPVCPRCDEPLETPGFEYGLCDACGSKYELVDGAKPGLLPNKKQRDEMNKVGRVRRLD